MHAIITALLKMIVDAIIGQLNREDTVADEVDPELLNTYEKLGIPLKEQEVLAGVQGAPKVAVDAVFDSVSVVTTFKEELAKARRPADKAAQLTLMKGWSRRAPE